MSKANEGELIKILEQYMKKLIDYIKAVRTEWFKIVWPPREAVIRATIMIFVFAGIAALFFFITDSILNTIAGWIY